MAIRGKVKLNSDAKKMEKSWKGAPMKLPSLSFVPMIGPSVVAIAGVEYALESPDKFKKSIAEGSKDVMEEFMKDVVDQVKNELKMALDNAIDAPVWAWEGGSRDIFDTGALKTSLMITMTDGRLSVSYSAPYASLVHDGGYIYPYGDKNRDPVFLPGRPWIDAVLFGGGPVPQFDYAGAIERAS